MSASPAPGFARQAAGTPSWALPFGRHLCDSMADALAGAGRPVRQAIEELASRDVSLHCQSAEIDLGGWTLRVFRDLVGPAPLSVRFGVFAMLNGRHRHDLTYRRGLLSLRAQMPESVVLAMKGRRLDEVIALPAGFPGADRPIHGAVQDVTHHAAGTITPNQKAFTYARIDIRVPHRQAFLSYDDIEHGRSPVPLAA